MGLNCIVNDSTLQVIRSGFRIFVAVAGETYYQNVGQYIIGVKLKYHKIVGGILTEMTAAEKDVIDALPHEELHVLVYPINPVETLIADGVISNMCYSSKITINNLNLTLADGIQDFHAKLVQSQGGSCTVTCSLPDSYISFTLSNNGKAQLMWHDEYWITIDSKNISYNL